MRVAPDRERADEWAIVLAAADIPHWLRQRLDGWALIVPAPDAAAALESLDAYDRENGAGQAPTEATRWLRRVPSRWPASTSRCY